MKTKHKLCLLVIFILKTTFSLAQDGNFDNLTFNGMVKNGGAAEFFGWGLNSNPLVDIRPNSANGHAFVINHHTGLTLSAHSYYGGIRFYNQGYPDGPLQPATGATMVMSITNNAVGIGTANPRVPLDVGTFLINQQLGSVLGRLPEGNGRGEGTFLGVRGYNTEYNAAEPFNSKSFALEHSFYGAVNSSINFYRGGDITGGEISFNTNSNVERMRIDGTGNVGIGTPTPKEKLSVNGKIRAQEIKVELSGWPDYVFKKEYPLPTLEETEKHIKEKGYLPGMPSAKEVEANGLELGEMNKKLIEKVEQLTLYLIKQNEINQKQNKTIKKLQQIVLKQNKRLVAIETKKINL